MKRCLRAAVGLGCIAGSYAWARLPRASHEARERLAASFTLTRIDLDEALGRSPARRVREVHPSLAHIAGWVSTVGAGAALADLDHDGLPNELVLVDPRDDSVLVAPVPGSGDRFAPFALAAEAASQDERSAPMGAVPGDVNADGRLDVVVYYWGRRPVAFLASPPDGGGRAVSLTRDAFRAVRLLDGAEEAWYTNALALADVDGDGRLDVVAGNYFADGARVLDPRAGGTVAMQDSMSRAYNGGRNRVLRCTGIDREGVPRYEDVHPLIDERLDCAWTLGVGAVDLTGDQLPEIYFANDFGPDRLLLNVSRPGRIELAEVRGERTLGMPRSRVLGHDSFKGMGVDFGDADGDGELDIAVSNIAVEYGLEESHLLFVRQSRSDRDWTRGRAPFVDRSEALGVSRSDWSWEIRFADLDDDGVPEILQATGFVLGTVDRWPELHEVAMAGDPRLADPAHWHRFGPDDGLSGAPPNAFYARDERGRYVDIAREVGFDARETSRAIATGDVDGDGDLDVVVANQWQASAFYRNDSPRAGRASLVLHLGFAPDAALASAHEAVSAGAPAAGLAFVPAIGAEALVETAGGRKLRGWVDGGSGHSGARSHEVHFGLGAEGGTARSRVALAWRDRSGARRARVLELASGRYTVILDHPELAADGSGPPIELRALGGASARAGKDGVE